MYTEYMTNKKISNAFSYAYTSGFLFGASFAIVVTGGGSVTLSLINKGLIDPFISSLAWGIGSIAVGMILKRSTLDDSIKIFKANNPRNYDF